MLLPSSLMFALTFDGSTSSALLAVESESLSKLAMYSSSLTEAFGALLPGAYLLPASKAQSSSLA